MSKTKIKKLRAGVFIDGANIFWHIKNSDWSLDYEKLKGYLKEKYSPSFYNYYGCEDDAPSSETYAARATKQKNFHQILRGMGYSLIIKPLKHLTDSEGQPKTKGDMDVDISVDMNNSLDDIDLVIFVGGDSDFLPAIKNCHAKKKYIRIFSFEKPLSWELKQFAITQPRCAYKLLDELKDELEHIKL